MEAWVMPSLSWTKSPRLDEVSMRPAVFQGFLIHGDHMSYDLKPRLKLLPSEKVERLAELSQHRMVKHREPSKPHVII